MTTALGRFLATRTPLTEEQAVWGDGESTSRVAFVISAYLSPERPPLRYVTSVRGLVFRGDSLLVMRNRDGTHIWPGGRREKGERPRQTLEREVLEETGWSLRRASPVGFLRFHHLSPKPLGYAYPYPDFVQLVYVAEAGRFVSEVRDPDDYEIEAVFRPVTQVEALSLSLAERLFLDVAPKHRARA